MTVMARRSASSLALLRATSSLATDTVDDVDFLLDLLFELTTDLGEGVVLSKKPCVFDL